MLTIRKRGRIWHIRGTVRVGAEIRVIQERSTGCDRREDAEAYKSRVEGELRTELLYGVGGQIHRLTIADAGLRYVNRPGGVASYDMWRMDQLNTMIGDYPISRAGEGWSTFKADRCGGLEPSTVNRFRSVLQAALNYLGTDLGFDPPKIPRSDRIRNKPIRYLSKAEEGRLLAAYAAHVQPIAELLCYQGLRIGEALRLEWKHVNWAKNSVFIADTKTDVPRTITLHEKGRAALHRVWVGQGSPPDGRVFLNRLGQPYADPRTYRLPGGSPIRRAHATACRRAGIQDFHVHDWRHHWACWCMMSEIDLETIRQEGGWASLRMVERYATVSAEHRARAMKKLR